MERPSLTSEESLSSLQTVIVVGPNAEGALGEVSVETAASVNPLNVPPGVEHPVDPPAIKVAPKSPRRIMTLNLTWRQSLLLLRIVSWTLRMQNPFMPRTS